MHFAKPDRDTLAKLRATWTSAALVNFVSVTIFLLSVVDFAVFLRLVVPDPPVGSKPAYTWEPILHIIGNIISILFGLQYVFSLVFGFKAYPNAGTRKAYGEFLILTGVIGVIGFGCLSYFLSPGFNAKYTAAVTYANPVSFNAVLSAAASAAATAALGVPTNVTVPFNTASVFAGSRYFGHVAQLFETDMAIAIVLCVLYGSNLLSGALVFAAERKAPAAGRGGVEAGEAEPEAESPSSAAGQPEMRNA